MLFDAAASPWFDRARSAISVTLLVIACLLTWKTGYELASRTPLEPDVITRDDAPADRRAPVGGPSQAPADQSPVTCPGASPGPSWSCQNGIWQTGVPVSAGGGGGGGANRVAGGCTTEAPGPSYVCDSGIWTIPSTTSGSGSPSSTASARDSDCPGPAPFAAAVCASGAWTSPGQFAQTVSVLDAPTPTAGNSRCLGDAPGAGWTCQDGGWRLPILQGPSTPVSEAAPTTPGNPSSNQAGTQPINQVGNPTGSTAAPSGSDP